MSLIIMNHEVEMDESHTMLRFVDDDFPMYL